MGKEGAIAGAKQGEDSNTMDLGLISAAKVV